MKRFALQQIRTDFDGERCFTHARAGMTPWGTARITMQPLRLSGTDVFYDVYTLESRDGGKTWSKPKKSETLVRRSDESGLEHIICDATPIYHAKSGTFLLIGQEAIYQNDVLAPNPRPRFTLWCKWDEEKGDWTDPCRLIMPEREKGEFFSSGYACGQCHEEENGDLLIPIHYMDYESAKGVTTDSTGACSSAMVLRCAFDGNAMEVRELGKPLHHKIPRGFAEPSIIKSGKEYFLALRNDETGYLTKSVDGMCFADPVPLCFDDGENAGNYCTQQHFITLADELYLVYTRKAENNNHVSRHRAPLWIARVDKERLCLIRSTEQIAVPERGARLGNFGCMQVSETEAWVVVSEWMQSKGGLESCLAHGSDNSIFIAKYRKD